MASKRKVRRRVAKALKKYVRGNPKGHHLEGWTAIAFAEKHGGTLKKYADPTERALSRVSIQKAKAVAREDPRLIYMTVPHGKHLANPPRVKGRKTKGGRAVTLKNFTGTIVKKSDGTVQIVGRGRRK